MLELLIMETLAIQTLPLSRWQEFKKIRLGALQTDPQAFSSPHAKEAAYPDKKWQERLKTANKEVVSWMLFACLEGKVIGMLGSYRDENDLKKHAAQIWGVYVVPEKRGQGIAKKLMTAILAKLQENPDVSTVILEVNTDQKSAQKLYERFGFVPLKTYPVVLGDGKEHRVTKMKKNLSGK